MGLERTGERLRDEIARAISRLLDTNAIKVDAREYVVTVP